MTDQPTLTERAERILELAGKATPGPWTIERYGDDECPSLVMHSDSENRICFMATPGSHGDLARIKADAKLIRAARNDASAIIRDLLAENARLQALAEAMAKGIDTDPWGASAASAVAKSNYRAAFPETTNG